MLSLRLLVLLVFAFLVACEPTVEGEADSLNVVNAETPSPSVRGENIPEEPLVLLEWEICKQGEGIEGTECVKNSVPAAFWGSVEEIGLFKNKEGFGSDRPGIYVKSKGCFSGGEPKELGWYSADASVFIPKGQTVDIKISETQELDESQTEIYMQTYANAPQLISGVPCTPLPENAQPWITP